MSTVIAQPLTPEIRARDAARVELRRIAAVCEFLADDADLALKAVTLGWTLDQARREADRLREVRC
jgi:hypothetical protein